MSKRRLIEIMDLVLQCKHWRSSHRAHLTVDNYGDHVLYIYPNVNNGGTATLYYADRRFAYPDETNYVYDPEFEQAEAHIKNLLEEIKMP